MATEKKAPYFKKINTQDKDLTLIQNNVEEVLKYLSDQLANTNVSSAGSLPIGSVLAWTSDISLPIGYVKMLGQELSRTEYSQLFANIGTRFGVGNGTTTFNAPNAQGLVLRGEGTQVVNGRTKDGGALGDVQEDQMQRITGNVTGITWDPASIGSTGAITHTVTGQGSGLGSSNRAGTIAFDSSDSPNARTSSATDGETRVSSLSVIWIIKAQNLETATATTSAVDSLNNRVSNIETQLPPPISSITGLGDVIKVGSDTRNSDTTYTVSFNTPFVAGTDSDISVVLNRQVANGVSGMFAINITKSGFQIDRENGIDGDQTVNYIAINGFYLT